MLKVLIIDDSMLVRHSVCRYFEARGFAVDSASDGAEALEILRRVQPDIIVTDMQMPKMGGLQLIMMLKSDPRTARIPVVVLAGKAGAEAAVAAPADYFISKDIDMEIQLQYVLETAFRQLDRFNQFNQYCAAPDSKKTQGPSDSPLRGEPSG